MRAASWMRRFAAILGAVSILAAWAAVLQPQPSPVLGAPAAQTGAQAAATVAAQRAPVWVTRATGIIDPTLAGYLVRTMKDAAAAGAAALVVEIDTPGGLDTSMRQIVQAELASPIPVVVYVYPQGARAASAGLYILMGADVAAMAPQTNVGAATPVALGGQMDDTEKTKVVNDAAAYIRSLASTHNRNAVWAEEAVRQAVSVAADVAKQQNVVDFLAPDLPSLLTAIDGHATVPKQLTLHTAGAPLHQVHMGWVQRFLHAIATPDLAYVLLTVGILGIILEFAVPGIGLAGVIGGICLLLSFYALAVLPVSLVGIALIVLGFVLFIAELKIQSHGALAVGGGIALVLGGLFLFNSPAAYLRVGWPVLAVVAFLVVAFFLFVVRAVRAAMRRKPVTGAEGLAGARGRTTTPLRPDGHVRVNGETWKARSEEGDLLEDEEIEVVRMEGLTLVVRRAGRQQADNGVKDEPSPAR